MTKKKTYEIHLKRDLYLSTTSKKDARRMYYIILNLWPSSLVELFELKTTKILVRTNRD
jgi:hypothetical protein